MPPSDLQTIPNIGPAVDIADGASPRPWWEYSRERKARAHG